MTGMKVVANLERRNARHWLWQVGTSRRKRQTSRPTISAA